MHTMGHEKGRDQEDALMLLLFSFCHLGTLNAVQNRLVEGERLFAFLDDVYVVTTIGRLGRPPQEFCRHHRIGILEGNHPVCNAAGARPDARHAWKIRACLLSTVMGSAKQGSGSRGWSTTESCSPTKGTSKHL